MEGFSSNYYHLAPSLVLEVVRAAREGDMAALEIVQLGRIFEAGKLITDSMRDIVLKHCPKAKLIRLD